MRINDTIYAVPLAERRGGEFVNLGFTSAGDQKQMTGMIAAAPIRILAAWAYLSNLSC